MKYREAVYACLDSIKVSSDDSYITAEHVLFFLGKVRALLLNNTYSKLGLSVPQSNYQTICINVIEDKSATSYQCDEGDVKYYRSTKKIPAIMSISNVNVYIDNYFQNINISYVSSGKLQFVGHNKWLGNIIYTAIGPDNYLYFKSSNQKIDELKDKTIKLVGLFEDAEKALELSCEVVCPCDEPCDCEGGCKCNRKCDILDEEFPLEEALAEQAIELVVKYLSTVVYKPSDSINNASDDLSDLIAFIRKNVKSDLQKKIEE